MTIAKGRPWGHPAPLPPDGLVVGSDAEAGAAVEQARRTGQPPPVLGLLGGDLCRTLGGRGDPARLTSADAVTFPVDIGEVLVDGTWHVFLAHLILRNRRWTRVTAVMNAALLGSWNPTPKAHPNDGLLDVLDARLRLGDLPAIRSRLPHGAHLPHPRIAHTRVATLDLDVRGRRLWLDGVAVDATGPLHVTVRADALTVVV